MGWRSGDLAAADRRMVHFQLHARLHMRVVENLLDIVEAYG